MQYRMPPASRGPSSNTWPRWPPQLRQITSVRSMPHERSSRSSTASATAGSVKLGQPVPESNFVSDENSSAPQPAQRNVPSSWLSQYLPVKARSVAPLRSTSYCSGVSSSRHWASVFFSVSMTEILGA